MDTAMKIYVTITLSVAVLVGWTAYAFITKAMVQVTQAFNFVR